MARVIHLLMELQETSHFCVFLLLRRTTVIGLVLHFDSIATVSFSYNGTMVEYQSSSAHEHHATSLGNYKNKAMAIGSELPSNKIVETMSGNQWEQLEDFPFVEEYISVYSIVTFQEDLFLFGKRSFNSVYNMRTNVLI